MDVKVIVTSHIGHEAEKSKFDDFSGKMIGLTNTPDNLKTLMYEDSSKALRRSENAKSEELREYFNHESFTLYFEGLPKIISILIDNERTWIKSEKSIKFVDEHSGKDEQLIYNKWIELFKNKITKVSKNNYTEKMLCNMAEDYAVYIKSVFSPVTAAYTVSYSEFNKLIGKLENYIGKSKNNEFENKLTATIIEFVMKMKELPYYDKSLSKIKDSSLFSSAQSVEEEVGDVYATSYKCSVDCFSRLIMNKDINFKMSLTENEYYIPSIIADNKDLCELWMSDIISVGNYPLAWMVEVTEMSTLDRFIESLNNKDGEYKNTREDVYKKYEYALRLKMHPRAEELIKLK